MSKKDGLDLVDWKPDYNKSKEENRQAYRKAYFKAYGDYPPEPKESEKGCLKMAASSLAKATDS